MTAHVFAFANQKGGVGKTSTSLNLSAALAELGKTVLYIDGDPQGHATVGLGFDPEDTDDHVNFANALTGDWKGDPHELIVKHDSGVHLIPNHAKMFTADPTLVTLQGRERRVERIIEPLLDEYDVIILDCPPQLSPLNDACIYAARSGVVVPMWAEPSSLRAVGILLDQIDALKEFTQARTKVVGLVVTQLDDSALARRVIEDLAGIPVPILSMTRKTTQMRNAYEAGQSVVQIAPHAPISQEITALAKAVLDLPVVAVTEPSRV